MDLEKELGLSSIVDKGDFKTDELGKGTCFYKHLARLGEQFWLFTLFHKADPQELLNAKSLLLNKAGVSSSKAIDELFAILKMHNGMQLFSNSLILYGVTDKVDYRYLSEPNSIGKNNTLLPKHVMPNWITFGYYSKNSSTNALLLLDAKASKENCFSAIVTNNEIEVVKRWDSIEEMLHCCIRKLNGKYDSNGYKIDFDIRKPAMIRNKTYIE